METIGLDFGSCNLKTNTGVIIPTKITKGENLFNNGFLLEFKNEVYTIGEGEYDTTLDKTKKEFFLPCLCLGLALSTEENFVRTVVGLPLNQYKSNKEELLNIIENNKILEFKLNGEDRTIYITEVEVFPEGIATYYSLNMEKRNKLKERDIIILDIGGRTTDIALLKSGIKRSVIKLTSLECGMINVYHDIISNINAEYTLGLEIEDAEKIIKNGLEIDGEKQDLTFVKQIIKNNIDKVFKELNINYPTRTSPILVTGGGGEAFFKSIKKRFPTAELVENNILSNALGYKKVGQKLWKD